MKNPSLKEQAATIERIRQRLDEQLIHLLVNQPIKLGMIEAIRIIESQISDYSLITNLRDKRSIDIAIRAVDYNRGTIYSDDLTEIPLREPFGYNNESVILASFF